MVRFLDEDTKHEDELADQLARVFLEVATDLVVNKNNHGRQKTNEVGEDL